MRIGFDIDGVLMNFIDAYQSLIIKMANGTNLFQPGDNVDPPCWDWPEFRGYDAALMKRVWAEIVGSRHFWFGLNPLEDVTTLAMVIQDLEYRHDIYYITDRPGQYAKRQTEASLRKHLPYPFADVNPTVIIAGKKGDVAAALKLDVYIDDRYSNIKDVVEKSAGTRAYLLNKRYNQGKDMVSVIVGKGTCIEHDPANGGLPSSMPSWHHEERPIRRVRTLGEMLDAELVNL